MSPRPAPPPPLAAPPLAAPPLAAPPLAAPPGGRGAKFAPRGSFFAETGRKARIFCRVARISRHGDSQHASAAGRAHADAAGDHRA